jgi:5-methylcytosine-specific restriction endonuclease McrA
MTLRFRQPRQKDEGHLKWVRQFDCIVCGDNTSTEAAHVRYADRSAAKRQTGMAEKSDDAFAVPLCGRCHRLQHAMGDELRFWEEHDIDPVKIGLALWYWRGDADACALICANARG